MATVLCPNCNAKYRIDEAILSFEGQKVRCTICEYLWIEVRSTVSKIDKNITNNKIAEIAKIEADDKLISNHHIAKSNRCNKNKIDKKSSIDIYTSSNDSSLWIYLMSIFNIACICLIFYNFSYAIPSFLDPIYRLMNIYDTKMVVMEKPNIAKCGDKCYKINMSFKNKDKFIHNMPRVKLSFINDKSVLQSIYLNKNDQLKLKPLQEYKFSKIVLNIPENTDHIAIEKGNIVELI
ncbi:MAG: zinc-ribbon domain-containing protein [Anaplasmataceae bacterium]|nr:zinc-ribbon domain-containing protein [Anaplasmataceae bacterium]